MKILYRPHCGTLSNAMLHVKEFSTLKEMLEYIVSETEEFRGKHAFDIEDIFIRYYGYDKRIDWETYIVCVTRMFNERYDHPQGIGFMTFKNN